MQSTTKNPTSLKGGSVKKSKDMISFYQFALDDLKFENEWLITLWDSLEWDELYSLMRSNHFSRAIRKSFKFYRSLRSVYELLPVVGLVGCAIGIIELFCKGGK